MYCTFINSPLCSIYDPPTRILYDILILYSLTNRLFFITLRLVPGTSDGLYILMYS